MADLIIEKYTADEVGAWVRSCADLLLEDLDHDEELAAGMRNLLVSSMRSAGVPLTHELLVGMLLGFIFAQQMTYQTLPDEKVAALTPQQTFNATLNIMNLCALGAATLYPKLPAPSDPAPPVESDKRCHRYL
jgi:hypothetical protein